MALTDLYLASTKVAGLLKNNQHPHLLRWYSHLESFGSTQDAIARLTEARSNKVRACLEHVTNVFTHFITP
jgi:hypothetical protein